MFRFAKRRFNQSYFHTVGLSAIGLLAASGTITFKAHAQLIDIEPPIPNVLLLLDTSGSMERLVDGRLPSEANVYCPPLTDPANPPYYFPSVLSTEANRWTAALQALTGTINNRQCVAVKRNTTSFGTRYAIKGKLPYDFGYEIPYHQPLSGGCGVVPGFLPGNAVGTNASDLFLSGANASFGYQALAATPLPCTGFSQIENGVLDANQDILRFAFMSFDTDPDKETGVSGNSVAADPILGGWSYFPGWDIGGSPATGRPNNCVDPLPRFMEVGARNPSAPPWEGRMMYFPSPTANVSAMRDQTTKIQSVINAIRPFGATPLAGMFADAKYMLWTDPKGPQKTDIYVQGNCRDEYIIVVTDGAPNLDLRPDCSPEGAAPGGKCPYPDLVDTISHLAQGVDAQGTVGRKVYTYVIGYAVGTIQDGANTIDCGAFSKTPEFATKCAATDQATRDLYGACCTLQQMATAGATGSTAYFANSGQDLITALNEITSKIGRKATTRTTPSYSPAVTSPSADGTSTAASVFYSSFQPRPDSTWAGNIVRTRYVCDPVAGATIATGANCTTGTNCPDVTKGDDFSSNLHAGGGIFYPTRNFLGVAGSTVLANPDYPLRPNQTPNNVTWDQLGGPGPANPTTNNNPCFGISPGSPCLASQTASTLISNDTSSFDDRILNSLVFTNQCPNRDSTAYLPASTCRDMIRSFIFGENYTVNVAGFDAFKSRATNKVSDIFHATPAIVGPPAALIRDEGYSAFKRTWGARPTVLYAPTNDGFVHAFDTGVGENVNNEIFAALIPAAISKLASLYPRGHQLILDGPPVVRDVVFDRTATQVSDATKWHTTLVAGFGAGGRGYYALDVTDPIPTSVSSFPYPTGTPRVGPQFLWQLTKTSTGANQIFGKYSANPAITTISLPYSWDSGNRHEIGVAILPGGLDNGPTGGSCSRDARNAGKTVQSSGSPVKNFTFRDSVRCWGPSGRSLSIVRVDTGEVIRTFVPHGAFGVPAGQSLPGFKSIDTPLDSPLVGTPIVYPSEPGSIAQRVYVGDADGTMWRFNLTDPDPSNWTGEIFFDTVNGESTGLGSAISTDTTMFDKGQPIQITPATALDRFGNLVLGIATGDQDVFTPEGTNYVYSITDKPTPIPNSTAKKYQAYPNWYKTYTAGARVSGPMAIYDTVFYWATYHPTGLVGCSSGSPYLWGRDFTTPEDSNDLSQGGVRKLNSDPPVNPLPAYLDPGVQDRIIPGVTINITPTCATTSLQSQDPYVPKASHYQTTNVMSGSPSLLAQIGGTDSSGKVMTVKVGLPTTSTPTIIDSWASVVE